MPADKFGFAPTSGEFKGVRTFGQEAKHIAFVIDEVSSAMRDQPNPSTSGKDENGPADIQTKEQVVKYLKDSFALAHKAMATLTNDNLMKETADPFNPKGCAMHNCIQRPGHTDNRARSSRPETAS